MKSKLISFIRFSTLASGSSCSTCLRILSELVQSSWIETSNKQLIAIAFYMFELKIMKILSKSFYSFYFLPLCQKSKRFKRQKKFHSNERDKDTIVLETKEKLFLSSNTKG